MKRSVGCAIILLLCTAWPAGLFAATKDATPVVYKVTVSKVEFYNSTTSAWVTVGQGNATFDIASVGSGTVAGSYASGSEVPEGDYTQIRVTISRSITIKATVLMPPDFNSYYTTTTQVISGSDTAIQASTIVVNYAEGTAVIPASTSGVSGDSYITTDNFPSTLAVRKGSTRRARVKFDVTNAARFDDGSGTVIVYPSKPSVTIQVVE
jgi:hypothetical protein